MRSILISGVAALALSASAVAAPAQWTVDTAKSKIGFHVLINGQEVFEDGWDYWYEPAQHRISLGCYPRGESFTGIIYRNITLKKH